MKESTVLKRMRKLMSENMPLFRTKSSTKSGGSSGSTGVLQDKKQNNGSQVQHKHTNDTGDATGNSITSNGLSKRDKINNQNQETDVNQTKAQLVFHCQLAHGSTTGLISGFGNVRELYQKIAECYELPVSEILFCTLNTHRADMSELLGGQIGLDDFIFAHQKGQPKEIELVKTEDALGLTITDNGAGYSFIKRIKEGSVIDQVKVIQVGDHIERINTVNLVGKRHFEVARLLKDIPKGATFTLRLIEPQKNGFGSIGPRSDPRKGKKPGYGSGKETLRFKADGNAQIQAVDDAATIGIDKINGILENFMGINDNELASQIWDLAVGKSNSMDFAEAIDKSDLEAFGFPDDFVIEVWGVVTDARSGRFNN